MSTQPRLIITPAEARAIAREAYIYGFPMVDSYRIQYSYFVDRSDPEFKAPWNRIFNTARLYTPEDRAVQSPNSDTPYSIVGADLRAEPLVLTIPVVDKGRYFSAQFIDLYTFDFAYAGSRTTGNNGGTYLLAGPRWQGKTPDGVDQVIRCETEFALVLYRTQLFKPADLDNVKQIQAGYKVQTLSEFQGTPAPPGAPPIEFPRPLSAGDERSSLEFFNILNFILQFCPTHPTEKGLMVRLASIGISAGRGFDARSYGPEIERAIVGGIADAWKAFAEFKERDFDTGKVASGDLFGTREYLQNNYLRRMAAAVLGIYGNSREEAIYPAYFIDANGRKLDAATSRYTLRFELGQLPPVRAFWSLTLYELPSSLLCANPLNRYLINSAISPYLRRDADGGLTLYIQHESPGKEKESNWLPAPAGPFFMMLRLYWPKPEALNGTWQKPPLKVAA